MPAAIALGLALIAVVSAAGIRIAGLEWLRPVQRVAASLEVLAVLALLWLAWRRPAAWLAAALVVVLSVVGIVAGRAPAPVYSTVNILGGLALVGTLARFLAEEKSMAPFLALLGVQVCLGAAIAVFDAPVVPLHAMFAIALTALLVWRVRKPLPAVLAVAALLAGFTTLHYESSELVALAHAGGAALLVACAAQAFAQRT